MVMDGRLWKRYDCKAGRTAPEDWRPIQPKPDDNGHWMGWAPLTEHDKWHWEAWERMSQPGDVSPVPVGTYELCGPKVGVNAEGFDFHVLIKHDSFPMPPNCLFDDHLTIWGQLEFFPYEGVVWHHPEGQMCKVKRTDFGLPWPLGSDSHD
jgi:hypothetical protein